MKKSILAAMLLLSSQVFSAPHELTVALRQDAGSWDPIDTFLIAWSSPGSNLYDGLLRRDEQLQLQPGLAERWEVADDGLTMRFYLRHGVKFHNGEPFNAEAVKFTFDRLLGEEGAKGPQRSNYTSIKAVKVIDEYTVEFAMNYSDPVMLTKLAGYGAMIVPPKYIQEHGDAHFNLHPVGTGPFKFVSYQQGDALTLAPNPEYFAGAPKLQKLTYRFIPEEATRLAEFQAGRVDILPNLPISAIDVLDKDAHAKVIAIDGPAIQSLQLNVKKGITKDVRVRKALNMAIDKQVIIDTILAGKATPIASLQSPLSFGYDPNLQPYPFDPEKAMQLLAEAGVAPGSKVTIDYRATDATFHEVAQAVTAFFGAVGLQAELRPVENAVFLDDLVPKGRTDELFQFGWGGWTFDFDNTAYLVYHSGEKWNPYGTSEKMDKLLEQQRHSSNVDERKSLLQAVAKLAHDEAYHIPLYNLKTIYAVANRVTDFVPAPDDRMRFAQTDAE